MKRIALIYGGIAGLVIIFSMILGMAMSGEESTFSQWLGYLIMVVALSLVFLGVKKYRDEELGGVIKFGTAFLAGLAITLVASVIYVVVWEITLVVTDYSFITDYTQSILAEREAEGATAAEMSALTAEMDEMVVNYGKAWYRIPITFLEIFPVGLLVSLISAAVLRNSKILAAS